MTDRPTTGYFQAPEYREKPALVPELQYQSTGTHHGMRDVPDKEVRTIADIAERRACGPVTVRSLSNLVLLIAYERGWRPGGGDG